MLTIGLAHRLLRSGPGYLESKPMTVAADAPARRRSHPVFLHTGWRSRGTWIWAALRSEPAALSFYEPLHEGLATLTPESIAVGRPDFWTSGHSNMAPYWKEYAGLLRPGVPGVPGYRTEFATENAFAGADQDLPGLAAYLRGLLGYATALDRVAVLKFCRSLGRVAWLRANFPEALHVVVLRRPDAQWASARRQVEVHRNPFFLTMPLLTLARNAEAPIVARVCRALHVPLPRLRQPDPERTAEVCRRLVDMLSWADRHRVFLAYWMAGAISALATDSLVLDSDMLLWSAQYRDEIATILRRSGLEFDLTIEPAHTAAAVPALGGEEAETQRTALGLLQEHRAALRPEGYLLAWNMIAAGLLRPDGTMQHTEAAEREDLTAPLSPPRPLFRNPWARREGAAATR